ncbi:iron ABC transporter substrate-binding protein [Croceicoccus ponticola]|uniref:Iron ABC transporter substrate-binding protein n=2 Tax=Croceicoccus ponticola TaxID=2217664 RepID=A0A437H2F7_9SPHN|nr:iron ABC transporter substrate-binding protein [Croceicoccus ponticola]
MLVSACAPAPAKQQSDGFADEVKAPLIVSLNPCADAILAGISPSHLIAVSHYSHDPRSSSMDVATARLFPAISDSAEEIAAFAPDVVVAGTFLPPATEQALARMGFRVVKTGSIASVDDARAQVRALAALTRQEAAGEAMIARMDRALATAAPLPGDTVVPAMIWQGGGIVPGEETLISDLLVRTGFRNFSAGRGLGQGAIVPLEDVLADPPRVLMVAGDGRMMEHPSLAALASGTRRVAFDPRLTFCGGPTIEKAALRLAAIRRDLPR